MDWRCAGRLLLLPMQMVFCVLKAAICLVLPTRLRDLRGDIVLITGGGRGIGRQLAREFAKQGAKKVRVTYTVPSALCTLYCHMPGWCQP